MPASSSKYPLDKTESIYYSYERIPIWKKASPYLKSFKYVLKHFKY